MTTRLQLLEAVAAAAIAASNTFLLWQRRPDNAIAQNRMVEAMRAQFDALTALDAWKPLPPLSQENQDARRTFPRGYYGEGEASEHWWTVAPLLTDPSQWLCSRVFADGTHNQLGPPRATEAEARADGKASGLPEWREP